MDGCGGDVRGSAGIMNCLAPARSSVCQCKCTCKGGRRGEERKWGGGDKGRGGVEVRGGIREQGEEEGRWRMKGDQSAEKKKDRNEQKSTYFENILQRLQQNFFRADVNKNGYLANMNKGDIVTT